MKRPEISLTEEPGTLPLGGSDPTEALPGAPGPRLVLGRYRLERRLGAGGFGVVWLAWDEKLEREVAVKAIPLENGGGERVEREARAAARLNHPGIVGIYELAADEHDVYLVSELVRGERSPSCCVRGRSPTATWLGSGWRCARRSITRTRGG